MEALPKLGVDTMTQYLWVALGGAFGASGRFWVSSWVNKQTDFSFPAGTLLVNVLGSFLFGFLFGLLFSLAGLREPLRLLVLVGALGAFTTFSTFSFETIRLLEEGLVLTAVVNVLASCILCLLGVWLGLQIGKAVF